MKPDSRGVGNSRAPRPANAAQPGSETVHRRVGSLANKRVEFVGVRVVEEVLHIAFQGDPGERFLDPFHDEHEDHQQNRKCDHDEYGHGVVIVPQ